MPASQPAHPPQLAGRENIVGCGAGLLNTGAMKRLLLFFAAATAHVRSGARQCRDHRRHRDRSSGAVLPSAKVTIVNRITNYSQTVTTDSKGAFRLTNIPPNPYHVEVSAPNFASSAQDVDVRSTVPVSLKISLVVAGAQQSVTVEANGADLLENVPYAHNDVDIRASPSFRSPRPVRA